MTDGRRRRPEARRLQDAQTRQVGREAEANWPRWSDGDGDPFDTRIDNDAHALAAARTTRELGREGEACACRYLEAAGMDVLDVNWRCREGEIDIVAIDDGELVVVEVKTRRSQRYGRPIEAVTHEKLMRLRRLASIWAREHEARVRSVRVDVIGVEVTGSSFSIDHRPGVQP